MTPFIHENMRKITLVLAITSIIAILLCFVRAGLLLGNVRSDQPCVEAANTGLTAIETGWTITSEKGTQTDSDLPASISGTPGETISLSHSMENISSGQVLFFDNNRQGMVVKTDLGELYHVNISPLTKQLRFTDYQILYIPQDSSEITLDVVVPASGTVTLSKIMTGSASSARYFILDMEYPTILLLFLLVILGIGVLITSIILHNNNITDQRLYALFAFLLFSVLWGLTDSYLPVLTRIPQEYIGLVCYFSLMALPVPICLFAWRTLGKTNTSLPVLASICCLNLIIEAFGSMMGLFQLQYTFYSAFILVCVIIAFGLYLFNKRIRNYPDNKEYRLIYCGVLCMGVLALLAMAMYLFRGNMYYRNCVLFGILLFMGFLLSSVISDFTNILHMQQEKMAEMKMMERFSYIDSLTGMQNRRAYEQKLEEIQKTEDPNQDAILIMMDLNGLKHTNDTFGHAAGDDLIVMASRAITEVYNDYGSCYRIGGDEFVVIMTQTHTPPIVLERTLDALTESRNRDSRWKISIARGTSHILRSDGTRISVSDWKQEADILMYKDKIQNAGSHSRIHEKDLQDIIDCIISTVEARDIYTASHSDRVRELSLCIGNHLGVSSSTMESLEISSHLHDIGKIGIPDSVLLKQDKLTEEEFAVIKQHPVIGAEIVSHAKGMHDISQIILYHHERYNGTGYPEGISGDAIPLESRIIAIADSIDAMTSRRCYRSPLSTDECREEIRRCSGTMYDPAIAQIVIENWGEIENIVLLHPKYIM